MILKEITIKDKGLFDSYLNKYPYSISELTFANLFAWRLTRKTEFTEIDNHLIVKIDNIYLQPVGKDPAEMIRIILKKEPEAIFERVEKKIAEQLKKGSDVTEQREMFDYIYDIEKLRMLEGKDYARERNFVNKFSKNNPDVCLLNEKTACGFLELNERWCNLKGKGADCLALTEAIKNFRKLELFGICVRVDDKVEGFAIGEKLNDNTFVEHFEKADPNFKGIYQFILNELAKKISKDFKSLNREQDLGIEGLRKSKLAYNPIGFIEKYKIRN